MKILAFFYFLRLLKTNLYNGIITIINAIISIIVVTRSLTSCCDLINKAAIKTNAPNKRNCKFLFIIFLFERTKVVY